MLNQWVMAGSLILDIRTICDEDDIPCPVYQTSADILQAIVAAHDSLEEERCDTDKESTETLLQLCKKAACTSLNQLSEAENTKLRSCFETINQLTMHILEIDGTSAMLDVCRNEFKQIENQLSLVKQQYYRKLRISVFHEQIPLVSARKFQNLETMRRLIEFFQTVTDDSPSWNYWGMTMLLRYSRTTVQIGGKL